VRDRDAVAVIAKGASAVLTVSEDEAAEAMHVLYAATHNVLEPPRSADAGAALAGLLPDRQRMFSQRAMATAVIVALLSSLLATAVMGVQRVASLRPVS
jgi:threonine dehydratase